MVQKKKEQSAQRKLPGKPPQAQSQVEEKKPSAYIDPINLLFQKIKEPHPVIVEAGDKYIKLLGHLTTTISSVNPAFFLGLLQNGSISLLIITDKSCASSLAEIGWQKLTNNGILATNTGENTLGLPHQEGAVCFKYV